MKTLSKTSSPQRHSRKRSRSHSGAAGFGGGLASPHDRARVRERNAAERTRVEQMFASGPPALDRRRTRRGFAAPAPERQPATAPARPALRAVPPTPTLRSTSAPRSTPTPMSMGCPVCASQTIVSDEVMHAGLVRLSECLHCDHRWTERLSRNWSQLGARMTRANRPRVVATARAAGSPG